MVQRDDSDSPRNLNTRREIVSSEQSGSEYDHPVLRWSDRWAEREARRREHRCGTCYRATVTTDDPSRHGWSEGDDGDWYCPGCSS